MRSVLRWSAVPLVAAALGVALLTGCVPETTADEPDNPGPNPSGDLTGQPAPTLSAEPTGTPVEQDCDDLIPSDTIYAFNPNFTLLTSYEPASGSAGASALAYDGLACRWQNGTSGDNIDVSVAQLDEASLTALKNAAFADSEMVPTYGDEAYFSVAGNGVGTAIVFQGRFWIVLESPAFFEPGDATDLVDSVIAGLGA
jgi:hypothetical protein